MDWRLKLIGERIVTTLPSSIGMYLHRMVQSRFTRVHQGNQSLGGRLVQKCASICKYADDVTSFRFDGKRVLELGTGWHGSDIAVFYVLGASEIHTCDVLPHLDVNLLKQMLRGVIDNSDYVAAANGVAPETVKARASRVMAASDLPEALGLMKVRYHAPSVLYNTTLPDDYFDLFYSHSVLQRICPQDLYRCLIKARKCLRNGAYGLHVIHHSDHNARHDRKLNSMAYLQYGNAYDWLQSKQFNYQNRLRHSEFIGVFQECGFKVVGEEVTRADVAFVGKMKLAKRFHGIPIDDLAIKRTQLICRAEP